MSELPHLIYTPENVERQHKWPLVVFLHGSGERGAALTEVKRYGLPRYIERGGRVPAYVIAPQCPEKANWSDLIPALDSLLEHILDKEPVSADQVSLTGFSMGGFGAWQWALTHPDRFSTLVPVGGSGLERGAFAVRGNLCTLRQLAIWIVHGVADTHVSVEGADECAELLAACGAAYRYTRYQDADHGQTCGRAYSDPELYSWMVQHVRRTASLDAAEQGVAGDVRPGIPPEQ